MKVDTLIKQLTNILKAQKESREVGDKKNAETIEENKRKIEARADDMDIQIAMVQVDTEFLMCLEELNEEGGE